MKAHHQTHTQSFIYATMSRHTEKSFLLYLAVLAAFLLLAHALSVSIYDTERSNHPLFGPEPTTQEIGYLLVARSGGAR